MKKTIFAAIIVTSILAGCKGTKPTVTTETKAPLNCSTMDMSFATDIKPIIEKNCAGCHNENNKAGYNFLTLASVKKAAGNGELLGTIKHDKGFPKMPKYNDKLDQGSIDKIECWMTNGMKD